MKKREAARKLLQSEQGPREPDCWSDLLAFLDLSNYGVRTSQVDISDPQDLLPEQLSPLNPKESLMRQCFTPSIGSIVYETAGVYLIIMAILASFAAGMAWVFAYVMDFRVFHWLRDIVDDASAAFETYDDKTKFMMYVVAAGTCFVAYAIYRVIEDKDLRSEAAIVEDYADKWIRRNDCIVKSWGYDIVELDNGRTGLVRRSSENSQEKVEIC